jgi:hypothetical protein
MDVTKNNSQVCYHFLETPDHSVFDVTLAYDALFHDLFVAVANHLTTGDMVIGFKDFDLYADAIRGAFSYDSTATFRIDCLIPPDEATLRVIFHSLK